MNIVYTLITDELQIIIHIPSLPESTSLLISASSCETSNCDSGHALKRQMHKYKSSFFPLNENTKKKQIC